MKKRSRGGDAAQARRRLLEDVPQAKPASGADAESDGGAEEKNEETS